MDVDISDTSLWKSAFSDEHCENEAQRGARDTLISELRKLDAYVDPLLKKIPEDCKGLTLHDITHVHQLWAVASVLCGKNYPINPSEGFVLGAAFLIHDAGLTVATHPEGLDGLRASPLYRDLVSNALKRADPDRSVDADKINSAPAEMTERALFELLRLVHAARAEKLLDQSYIHPILKTSFTLIPPEMLLDFGDVIGKVAASHNWDIKTVDQTFDAPLPPPAAYSGWTVDAVKLACILRAADACAIDQRRARIMSFIVENPRGISRSHWMFQARLRPGYLPENGETLIFSSNRPFPRSEMDSWWLAYDAIVVADRELRECDRLLKRRKGHHDHHSEMSLKAVRVEGSGDAEELSKNIRVEGWRPVDTSVRIDDPIAIINNLGGRNLYGDDASAPLRELLQNAADAVRARRELNGYDPRDGEFPGRIEITIQKKLAKSADYWKLAIVDNGVGMREDVLTGELLEFGKSLWRSDRLASVYPGLAAKKNFRPTGRFGIGFYAVFTIASDVKVISKPYLAGEDDKRVLHFMNGVSGRGELRPYDQSEDGRWPHGASTIVELRLADPSWFMQFAYYANLEGGKIEWSPEDDSFWKQFLGAAQRLIFSLDVETTIDGPFMNGTRLNKVDIFTTDAAQFISQWNLVFGSKRLSYAEIDTELHSLIDVIGNVNVSKSRGCVETSGLSSRGIIHIGGFTVFGMRKAGIQGVVEFAPITTNRRNVRPVEPQQAVSEWGNRQLKKLELLTLPTNKLSEALIALWDLDVDISDHYFLWDVNGSMVLFSELHFTDPPTIFLAAGGPPFNPFLSIGQIGASFSVGREIEKSKEYTLVLTNSYGLSSHYNRVSLPPSATGRTAFDRLLKCIVDQGFATQVDGPDKYVIGKYTGPDGGIGAMMDRNLKRGDSIEARGLVIRTTRAI